MKKSSALLCCLLALCLALPALAGPIAEVVTFQGPCQTGVIRVDRVVYTRTADYVLLSVDYTLSDTLTDAERDALGQMHFALLPDAEGFIAPQGRQGGSVAAQDEAYGAAVVAGASYTEKSQWDGLLALPETIYLRPYYKDTGTFGAVITLRVADGELVEIGDVGQVPLPYLGAAGGNG